MSAGTVEAWRGVGDSQQEDQEPTAVAGLPQRSRALLGELLRPYRRQLGLVLGLVLVENAAAMAGPYLIKVGIDRGIPAVLAGRGRGGLFAVLALLGAATVVQAAARQEFLVRSGGIGQGVLLALRRRVFDHFQRLSLAFHERYTSGRVISRLTSDFDALAEVLESGLDGLVTALLSIVTTGAALLLLDVPLGLVALLVFPLLVWLSAWFRRESAIAYRRTRETVALVIVHFVETLGGIRAVQAFRREPRNAEIFGEVNNRYRAANARSFRLVAIYGPGVQMLGNITVAGILFYGGLRALHGDITVGTLTAFLLYLRRFFEPMQELTQFYNSFQSGTAALEKLAGVLAEAPSVPETDAPVPLPGGRPAGGLRLEGVEFGYGERSVLPHLDLTLPAGQTVALVGATGAGKTTLARLLARFYDPRDGRVTLDGVDLRELEDETLRQAVVLVTQESFLFSGSVADNIAFGRPEATRAEVEAAARAIGAHEFISALPYGYDTDVRKRGGRLSAGQRQLVSFARAFLADPAVLILDEATSSLDVPSERLVQQALHTMLRDRTAVIIAHRLTTVEVADRVLVMEAGRIVEDGAPSTLLGGSGRYAGLHQAWAQSLV